MRIVDIERRQEMQNIKHEVAKKIRALLDEARVAYDKNAKASGGNTWEEDSVEGQIIELVTEE
jgi:hypothetical protein